MSTKQIIKDDLAWMDQPIKATKWRNLRFKKDGSAVWGSLVYESEEAAQKRAEECVAQWSVWPGPNFFLSDGYDIREHSHHIPMPVGD
jgi:hypothetical protein